MSVDKRAYRLFVYLVIGSLSSLLMSCAALSGSSWPRGGNSAERKERVYDTVSRIKELEYRDFIERMREGQWDSVQLADLGQPYSFSYPKSLADSVIEYAMQFLSVPYASAGKGPDRFDCSGFTSYVFRHFGYELRASSSGQLNDGWKVIRKPDKLKPGDLVFYGGRKHKREIGHVGIVVSNDVSRHCFYFIHATVKLGVTISSSTEAYYVSRYITACRILPE